MKLIQTGNLRPIDLSGIQEVLPECAEIAQAAMIESFQQTKTGRVYRRGGLTHTASAAGESPAVYSGRLSNSFRVNRGTNSIEIQNAAVYASRLEDGLDRPIGEAAEQEAVLDRMETLIADQFERAWR